MFGCLVAGRLLQTNLVQIDETQGTFSIPSPETINHICVFLLGTVPFPDGYAATVHLHLPGKGFQLLGMISNVKPSAVFRVRNAFATQNTSGMQALGPQAGGSHQDSNAVLGISIEAIESVMAQVATLPSASSGNEPSSAVVLARPPSRLTDPAYLAQKVAQNLFNYLSSFGSPGSESVIVHMDDLKSWYDKLLFRIKNSGPAFLDRDE